MDVLVFDSALLVHFIENREIMQNAAPAYIYVETAVGRRVKVELQIGTISTSTNCRIIV